MAQVITIAGEKLFATKAQANQQLDIDTFIFANVAGQDPAAEIDRNEGIPTAAIVHQQNVQQTGRINDNVVVYSTVLDSVTGPFEFNWVGLYSSVNQTLVAISHVPTVAKTITAPGSAGNTLNRNFGIEYSGIADLAGISVSPETWQLDFSARLSGMDELTRQLASDMNGKDWFIDDGFKVVPRSTANTFSVTPGVGYVSGLRVELKQEHILTLQTYPQFVYIDAYFDGNASSQWKPQVAFTVSNTEMDDYIDTNGVHHYMYKISVINSIESSQDFRSNKGVNEKINRHIDGDLMAHRSDKISYQNRSVEKKLKEIVSPGDNNENEIVIISIKEDPVSPTSWAIIIGDQYYNAEDLGAGSVLVGGYGSESRNKMPGKALLRAIIGGYDNFITSGVNEDGAESAGLACCIIASHHSEIRNKANHCTIAGGSYNFIDNGIYNVIVGGTGNEIRGTYNSNGLQNNSILGGARNKLDGANSAVAGNDNKVKGVGSLVAGGFNEVGEKSGANIAAVFGGSNIVDGDGNACFGFNNNVRFNYSLMCGRENKGTANYQSTGGRKAVNALNFARAHGFGVDGQGDGTAQSINYQLTKKTTNDLVANMASISQGILGPEVAEGAVSTYKGIINATDGTDVAIIEVEFAYIRNGVGKVLYNNSTIKHATTGASAWSATFGGQYDGRLSVTGEQDKIITWYANIDYIATPI